MSHSPKPRSKNRHSSGKKDPFDMLEGGFSDVLRLVGKLRSDVRVYYRLLEDKNDEIECLKATLAGDVGEEA